MRPSGGLHLKNIFCAVVQDPQEQVVQVLLKVFN